MDGLKRWTDADHRRTAAAPAASRCLVSSVPAEECG
jgi:hypothetical protein